MEPPKISKVSDQDQDRVILAMTIAFSADPLMRWFYPDPSDYLAHFPHLLRAHGGRAFEHGSAYTTSGFEGGALWLPPGVSPDEEALGEMVERTIAEEKREDLFGLFAQMDDYHPHDQDTWYLPDIGVDPFHQRKGIGAALLHHQLQQCDDAGIQTYLESTNPANMSLYERHGFRTLGRIDVGSAPPVHPMLRPIGG